MATQYGQPTLKFEALAEQVDEKAAVVAHNFDMQVIYGNHQTEDDASAVLSFVRDDCIALSEGHMRSLGYANLRLAQHISIASARLAAGTYEGANVDAAQKMATEFTSREQSPHLPPDVYGQELYEGLVQKNAVILPTDYIRLSIQTLRLPDLTEENLLKVVDTRERHAVLHILNYLDFYHRAGQLGSVAHTGEGKTRVTVIFGLAHRNSLTSKLADLGISTEVSLALRPDDVLDEIPCALAMTQSTKSVQ